MWTARGLHVKLTWTESTWHPGRAAPQRATLMYATHVQGWNNQRPTCSPYRLQWLKLGLT